MRFATAEPIGVLPRGPAGPAGINFQGVWSPNSTYSQRSVVLYQAALWYARRGSTGRTPGSDPTYWDLMLPKGTTGATGATPTLEWRQTADALQVRRIGDASWLDAVALDDITGPIGPAPDVEWRGNGTHLQVRAVGDPDWIDVVALADITGPQGDQGEPGPPIAKWQSGMTATIGYPYAFDNAVWRALAATTTDPVEGADWEKLYDGAAITHDHDDRYYTKTASDARYPLATDTASRFDEITYYGGIA